MEGTRELPLPPLPFLVVYRIRKNIVEIANVIHGAQKWPPKIERDSRNVGTSGTKMGYYGSICE